MRHVCLSFLLALPLLANGASGAAVPDGGYFTGPGNEVWNKFKNDSEAVLQQVRPEVLEENRAFGTARFGHDFTYHIPVPHGEYTVRIGYAELLYIHPGVRVFSILVNGETLEQTAQLDLVQMVLGDSHDPYDTDGDGRISTSERRGLPQHHVQELKVRTTRNHIDLRFLSSLELKEEISVSWIEVKGEGVDYFIDCGGDGDLPGLFEDDSVGVAVLARLGSMIFFDMRPPFGDFAESPLGKWGEHKKLPGDRELKPFSALIGFQTADGTRYSLPFYRNFGELNRPFEQIEESRTLTTVRYDVAFRGYEGSITFRSPFHPGDRKLTIAPYFDIDFEIRKSQPNAPPVRALFFLPVMQKRERHIAPSHSSLLAGAVATSIVDNRKLERGLFVKRKDARRTNSRIIHKNRGIQATLDMPVHSGSASATITYAAHVAQPVLTVDGEKHRFEYTQHFKSLEEVAAFAIKRRTDAVRASEAVDRLLEDAILPGAIKELATTSFSSFLINTYLTVSDDGDPWYSCLEGFCRYHATVDVEYNAAPFYVWFAPDLLRHLLGAWPRYLREDDIPTADGPERHWFLSHDLGIDDVVDGQAYPHDMPVEENTNYVLLLHQYWTWFGETGFVLQQGDAVVKLLDYVVAADLDGDGCPEHGAANTIDDAPPAVQFSREQVYLAVKSAAAMVAGAEILAASDDAAWQQKAEGYLAQAKRIQQTIDAEGWLDDHYAVCLDRTTEGLENPWDTIPEHTAVPRQAMSELPEGELTGWDHAHPYTSLGLLYLLRGGSALPFDEARIRQDLITAAQACARRFADGHTETEANGWVSLNLFRDAVQGYLGDDVLDRAGRYNDLQRYRARALDMKDRAGFCDSLYNRYLSYYPRGTAVFGLIDSAAGIVLDRRKSELRLRPVRAPLKVPLPYLADWNDLRVPWFEVTPGADGPTYQLTEQDLLSGFTVVVDLSLVGGGVETLPAGR